MKNEKPANTTSKLRPPIIAVLGHVDHGKTTLLDAIRKTSVAAREAGGITQSIGASKITFTSEAGKDDSIVFIDTPGHAAFSKMRSQGAKVADIAVLVVDASDGVKPQTLEALDAIRQAQIPFIVAATKMDLPSASLETVQGQLEKEGVTFEGRGGDVPVVAVSAKKGTGLNELLGTIILVSEVKGVEGNPEANLEAVVIETSKDKRGPLTSVIVRDGTLKVGEEVFCGGKSTKVRGLFDGNLKPVKVVLPSEPAQILGFEDPPEVGNIIKSVAEAVPFQKQETIQSHPFESEGQISIIVKTKNAGALTAILANLPKEIVVIDSGVGDIYESDVLRAKASNVKYIFAFESKAGSDVLKLAASEGVKIEIFKVIYELFDKLNEFIKGGQVEILGKAEIVASFPFNRKKIAGCKMKEGKIGKTDELILMRQDKEIGRLRISSLKRKKQEITEAKSGEEFGVLFEPQLDFVVGDMLVSVRK
ncbi:hypothetical protein A2210_01130 [Candidatus Woesebacteria bacterium RIFOXYA1_FULL_40_18]|uniref:Tr-type G domain-containing protein n=4 Tax=Candidatus Woeseibacteriota TaxID=1752722 RepID=A0A1F8CMF7_9BACT|nr:MAG: Translation initiation factor IF-2 [Candidatus Woesebacteria bacterium GW2011_GWB1_40_101]OGM77039.1 MAG: hypothetical protein A2210_01130 [Candidatus Woesebacteria bacterium RIFOXYA1_FULL_40_18]OGM81702.1 MAG: hypothetical protein A2361_00525 [Candidatus Woesebacteria bacterium RIFOXYB1_FULL_40_26]OGM88723.1 MAG: hypothetical protein A2614_00675 [Candidatus Woesebacteria bacterium RIFOXYD1_FULL_40_21]